MRKDTAKAIIGELMNPVTKHDELIRIFGQHYGMSEDAVRDIPGSDLENLLKMLQEHGTPIQNTFALLKYSN